MTVASSNRPDHWRMPATLRASVGFHALAAGVAVMAPQTFPWVISALAANHALLTAAGLWPRSNWLGPNLTRLPPASAERREIALTIDDGPDPEVTPRVLDMLDQHGQRATFFCIADRVAEHPALTREILARGHSVQNHSAGHRHTFSMLGPRGFHDELSRAQAVLEDVTGVRPTCFRAPAGLRNPFLDHALYRVGLQLVSWTRRGFDTRDADPARVLARLTASLAGGDILLLHDGHAARTASGKPVVLEVLPALFSACTQAGLTLRTLPEALEAEPVGPLESEPRSLSTAQPHAPSRPPVHSPVHPATPQ